MEDRVNKVVEGLPLSTKVLDDYKLNNQNIILYPIFKRDKIELEEILIISRKEDKFLIDTNNKIMEESPDLLELILFIKEVEEFLLLEDEKSIEKKLEDFNTQYMSIAISILDLIFQIDGDLKILGAKIDFDSFMSDYRYRAMKYGLDFLSKTILSIIPEDTKKIYLASTSGLNKMSSYSI
jgi:hypothetical protein